MSYFRLLIIFIFLISFVTSEIKNKGWWKNLIFYEVFSRSFMDSNGDGTGDLKGIISKLDHFVDLGIEGIWMTPINTSPMVDIGYDISDFRNIDPLFGNLDNFEELIKKAKELGIRVIMDFVPNHTSVQHDWFINSINGVEKYKDYYIWRQGKASNTEPPNNWVSFFHSPAWRYNEKRDQWYLHQFEYRQADLNYTNPNVQREMVEILEYWLDKGVNGFRIDAPGYIYEDDRFLDEPLSNIPGYTKNERNYLKHIYTRNDPRDYDLIASWKKVVDDWTDSHDEEERILMTESYLNSAKFYNYGVTVPLNFNLITLINDISKPSDVKDIIDGWMNSVPPGEVANWVTSNHDVTRIPTRNRKKPDLLVILAMILPGVACVYYGDEISMEDNMDITWEETQDALALATDPQRYKQATRDPSRSPFQWDNTMNANFSNAEKTWLPINKNHVTLNLEKQKSEQTSPYNLFKTLSKLKSISETLKNGSLKTEVLNSDKVLIISRQSSVEAIVLLCNFSDDAQTVDIRNYLPGTQEATIIVSSRESNVAWGSLVSVSKIEIPASASIVLVGTA